MLSSKCIPLKSNQNFILLTWPNFTLRHSCNHKLATQRLYETLGVTEDCEDETLRLAFVHLAKTFHPDSGTEHASALRFAEIESAYREIQRIRNDRKENDKKSEVEEFDIKHTAPQHRHYLTYNVGIGTLSKRQRLATVERAEQAIGNVMEHRLKKLQAEERNTLVGKDKQRAKDIKTRYGMDRLVEDLIQEAMNRGEFSALSGMGKPLKDNASSQNPYVDFVTHKLNQVLIENGFTPEWIQLSKEIRQEMQEIKNQLIEARNELGASPLNSEGEIAWSSIVQSFATLVKKLNNKIDKYNLLVPILQKQMVHVKLEALADEVLRTMPIKKVNKKQATRHLENYTDKTLLTTIFDIFSPKKVN